MVDAHLPSPNKKNQKLYRPVFCIRFNYLKAAEPLRGGSLLFTTKFPEISGIHLINIGRMKDRVDLGPTYGFEHETHGLGIQYLNHLVIAHALLLHKLSKLTTSKQKHGPTCKPKLAFFELLICFVAISAFLFHSCFQTGLHPLQCS